MPKSYETMAVYVGKFVLDTTDDFKDLIKGWLNEKYVDDISKRHAWSALCDFDYTFPTVASTSKYSLPADFDQELAVVNLTDGKPLKRYTERLWWQERGKSYSCGSIQPGDPLSYIVLKAESKIFLDPTPTNVKTIAMPYQKACTALSASGDTVVIDNIDHILQFGAIGEALAYKKQYQKADYYFARYEDALSKRIDQEKNTLNQLYQNIPAATGPSGLYRFTGNSSYDTV